MLPPSRTTMGLISYSFVHPTKHWSLSATLTWDSRKRTENRKESEEDSQESGVSIMR